MYVRMNYSYTSLERISRDQAIVSLKVKEPASIETITENDSRNFCNSLIDVHCLTSGFLGVGSAVRIFTIFITP